METCSDSDRLFASGSLGSSSCGVLGTNEEGALGGSGLVDGFQDVLGPALTVVHNSNRMSSS